MIVTISIKEIITLAIIAFMIVALIILYFYACIDEWRQKRKKKK